MADALTCDVDDEEVRLYLVLLVFVDRRCEDAPLRFEHGITSGIDEEDALTTAMEKMGENHRGETLLDRYAHELTYMEVSSLFDFIEPEVPTVQPRKISRIHSFFALLLWWMR